MRIFVAATLVVAGVIHCLPLTGIVGGERLAALYGLTLDEPNLSLLMRHRAALFGILGALLIAAAFRPALRVAALAAGLASVVSFLLLAWLGDGYNASLARVVAVDILALVCLLAGASACALEHRRC